MERTVFIGLALLLFITGCFNEVAENEAPGCAGGSFVPTGCLGKSVIKEPIIAPSFECVALKPNNCNGGVLRVENRCDKDLRISDVFITKGSSKNIELVRGQDGNVIVIEPRGNFDSYNPDDEDLLMSAGTFGNQNITISYTKKNVCGKAKSFFIPEEDFQTSGEVI